MAETQANADSTLARTVVEMGLATDAEMQDLLSLREQLAKEDNERSISDLLVSNEIITEKQLQRVRDQVAAKRGDQQIPGYQILEKLGAGAMATVYKARQISLDRVVAIKVLPRKFIKDPQFVERFYAEGRAAAKLNHPNIVQAYDVGKAGDFHYFVMEYVEGHSVYDHLQQQNKYEETEALRIALQIAEALNHAHQQGFMHRDVKPKNIMITPDGTAKLADMGLARQVSDREAAEAEAGKAYGTPYYISPEQIRGEIDVDFRADIYGLGATFYHMVTGKVPFDGANPSAVMHKHLKEELAPPDHVNADLSQGVSEVIEVMMAKNRDERYTSTAAMIEDLRAVANGEPPLQARRKFELSQLADVEAAAETQAVAAMQSTTRPLAEQPLFWVAVGSIALNVVLIAILVILATG